MPKITINSEEYDTDNFNEAQISAYNEIQICSTEMSRLSYTYKLLESRRSLLATFIEEQAKEQAVEPSPDEK